MGLNANNVQGGGKPRVAQENLEPDVYRGRLVQILDLGLQAQKPYQGKEKAPVNMIGLTYELVDEFMKDENGKELQDKPRWVSEELPFYGLFADKAKSTQRYNAFDPEGVFNGDFAKCIGVPVNVTIVRNVSGGKIYDNVGNVAAMSEKKKASMPELKNKPKVFDLDNPDMEVFNQLPKWIQDKIKGNLNYKGSKLEALAGKFTNPAEEKQEAEKQKETDNNPY